MLYTGISTLTQANSLDETTIIRDPAHWWSKDRYNSNYYLDQHGANMVPVVDVDGDIEPSFCKLEQRLPIHGEFAVAAIGD